LASIGGSAGQCPGLKEDNARPTITIDKPIRCLPMGYPFVGNRLALGAPAARPRPVQASRAASVRFGRPEAVAHGERTAI